MRGFTQALQDPAPRALSWIRGQGTPKPLLARLVQAAIVVGLIIACGAIVYAAGGTRSVYPHLFYVPVILAAYQFGLTGAVLAGVASGLVSGPIMPLDRSIGVEQEALAWIYRMLFFTGVGTFTASLLVVRRRLYGRERKVAGELFDAYGRCLTTFASLVSMRDEPTAHHCERVAANAVTLGKAAGLSEQELKELYWEGILHDLGKVGTPAHILLKPGKLTEDEYREIKKHAAMGAEILTSISPRFATLASGVRSHHERWDGTGYPDGLKGESIPLNGRILAIVDVFEALTSDRPYRSAMTQAEAVRIIQRSVGTHFDPDLTALFLRLHGNGRFLVQGDPVPGVGAGAYTVPGYSVLRQDAV